MNRCHMPSRLIRATLTGDFLAVCSVSNIVRVSVCVGKRTDERFDVPYGTDQILETSCKTFLLPPLGYRSRYQRSTLRLGAIHMHRRDAPTTNSLRWSVRRFVPQFFR